MRALSFTETAIIGSVAASVLCVVVPAFVRNVHASRLVEPMDGLERIAARSLTLAMGRPVHAAFPGDAPLTPAVPPRGELKSDPPGTWDHPTWRELGFGFSEPHAFAFAFDSENQEERSTFQARAHGDLDGDGVASTFSIAGEARRGEAPRRQPIEIHREVE